MFADDPTFKVSTGVVALGDTDKYAFEELTFVTVPNESLSVAGVHTPATNFKTCPFKGAVPETVVPRIRPTTVPACVPVTSPDSAPVKPTAGSVASKYRVDNPPINAINSVYCVLFNGETFSGLAAPSTNRKSDSEGKPPTFCDSKAAGT